MKNTDETTRATTLIEFLEGDIAGLQTEIERLRADHALVNDIRFLEYMENFLYGMTGLEAFVTPEDFADSIHAED